MDQIGRHLVGERGMPYINTSGNSRFPVHVFLLTFPKKVHLFQAAENPPVESFARALDKGANNPYTFGFHCRRSRGLRVKFFFCK